MSETDQSPQSTEVLEQVVLPPENLAASVLVLSGSQAGEMHRIDRTPMLVGREDDSDIVLDDHGVSRYHCRFVLYGDDVYIEDVGSTNGTFCNYDRVERARLSDGDRIRLGQRTVLKFNLQDETEEAQQRRLYEAAVRDPLTGAYNRRYFTERMTAELAFSLRHLTSLSVILVDVDHFRTINERFGQDMGDSVLVQLVQLLRSRSRVEDVFARLGADQFAMLARGLRDRQAFAFGERLRELIEATTITVGDAEMQLTVSVGYASVSPPAGKVTAESLLQRAEAALHASKEGGRNQVSPTPPPRRERARRPTQL